MLASVARLPAGTTHASFGQLVNDKAVMGLLDKARDIEGAKQGVMASASKLEERLLWMQRFFSHEAIKKVDSADLPGRRGITRRQALATALAAGVGVGVAGAMGEGDPVDDRVELRAPGLPLAAAWGAEARLRALQSVCGCSAAAFGLFIGGALAWWQNASAWAVVGCAFGAAVVAKVGAVSAAYAAFMLQLSALRRALRDVDSRTGPRRRDV